MYEMNNILDSDDKIYMSLDDIIRIEGIKKPGPGSVKSVYSNASRRSTYSNRSKRSTYSNRSRRSTYSNRSRHSNYSNKSGQRNQQQFKYLGMKNAGRNSFNRIGGVSNVSEVPFKVLKRPGVYTPNNNSVLFYKTKVRQAVRTLTNPIGRKRNRGFGRMIQGRGTFNNVRYTGRQMMIQQSTRRPMYPPQNIQVSVENRHNRIMPLFGNTSIVASERHHGVQRLTKESLALFDRINRRNQSKGSKWRNCSSNYSNNSQHICARHSVRRSLNYKLQEEIKSVQAKSVMNSNYGHGDMDFVPTPFASDVLLSDRFSSYD